MALRIIFARHGESEANLASVFANRREHAYDLTPAGIAQANALARSLVGAGVTHVYTSPVRRAAQTAAIVAAHLGVPLTEADGLREYDVGDYEGLPYAGDHAWRLERYAAVEADWERGARDARHPGGESLAELEDRFLRLMETFLHAHAPSETVVALSHGGLLRVVLPAILPDLHPAQARAQALGYAGRVVAQRQGDRWRCIDDASTG